MTSIYNFYDFLRRQIVAFLQTRVAAVFVLALLVVMAFVYFPRDLENGFFSQRHLNTIVFGICVSAATAGFVEAFPFFTNWLINKHTEQGRFLRFFGHVTSETRGAILVFSDRTITDGSVARSLPHAHEIVPKDINAEAEGITGWIPAQDLRGANYVAGELAKIVKQTAYYRTDSDIRNDPLDQIRATIFSFGLGFNEFTYRIITSTGGGLFDVKFSESAHPNFTAKTDNIYIPNYGTLVPPNFVDCAIVARVVHPSPKGSPSRYFFVCAGRTATGTAVAGRYLANNWSDLFKMYGSGHDLTKDSLLVVVSHKYDLRHGEDDFGEIACDRDGKQLVRWCSPPAADKIESRDDTTGNNDNTGKIFAMPSAPANSQRP